MKNNIPQYVIAELAIFEQEWIELAKKHAHLLSKGHHFQASYFGDTKNKLSIDLNRKHKATQKFKVEFEDGISIGGKNMSGNRILASFIKHVGAEMVYAQNILTTSQENVLSYDRDAISNQNPLPVGNGLYAITKIPNPHKINIIETIIEKCNIPAKVVRY